MRPILKDDVHLTLSSCTVWKGEIVCSVVQSILTVCIIEYHSEAYYTRRQIEHFARSYKSRLGIIAELTENENILLMEGHREQEMVLKSL